MRSEDLIGELTAGLRPVRRMARPSLQAGIWLGLAAAAIGGAVAAHGVTCSTPFTDFCRLAAWVLMRSWA